MTDKIKVTHPDFGYVVFTNSTKRQKEILNTYEKLMNILAASKKKGYKFVKEIEEQLNSADGYKQIQRDSK